MGNDMPAACPRDPGDPCQNTGPCGQAAGRRVIKNLLHVFGEYYKAFTHSALEKEFLAERELTREEGKSLAEHAQFEQGFLTTDEQLELIKSGLDVIIKPRPAKKERIGAFSIGFFESEVGVAEPFDWDKQMRDALEFY